MTSAGAVTVEVQGRDVNLVALLNRLDAQMRATDQVGLKLSSTVGTTFTAAQRQAANAALSEAQALARTAVALGDNARAHQILANALGQSAGASDRSVAGVTSQIAKLQSGAGAASQFGSAMKSSLLGIVGPAAAASAALGAVTKIVASFGEAFKFKADLDATTASIRAQLTGVRDSNQVFSEGAQFAEKYKLTQQETTEAIAASIGVMRSSKAGVEDILSVLARLQVLSPEQSLQEAAIAVKALASGDTTSLVTRFEVGRDVAGQMKQEIQGGADAVSVLNKFLNDTGIGMDALAAKTVGASGKIKDLARAQEELKLAQADFAQGPGIAILEEQVTLTRGATRGLTGDFTGLSDITGQLADRQSVLGAIFSGVQIGLDTMSAATMTAAEREQVHAQAVAQGTTIQQEAAAVDQLREQRMLALSAATEDSGSKSLIDAQAKQTETAQTELLAAQTQAAVDAFLALNPNMTASGAAAAAGAAGMSPLIARLIEATLRAREATNALAAFNALQGVKALRAPAAGEAEGEVRGFNRGVRADELKKQTDAAHAAAAAEREYQKAIGNIGPALERAQHELDLLPKGSEAAWNKMIEIERLKQQQASASRQRGAKAAGAAHLTDQQRLNNTLLSDQEKFQDQSEAAEKAHNQKLLDIDREFQKKSLEQQRANELSKREGELGFLKSITESELNATKEGRAAIQAINERFYADFAKAQEAAQAGNAKQSEEMVEQARKRAEVEQQYAEKIDKARKDKNQSEVTRLQALLELERQLLDEQSKQIEQGGDTNVNARNEALTEEQRRFEEQQGKIGDAADNAAQRKIDAALRSGKAIEAENLQLQQQEAIINRIGNRGAPGTSAGGGTGTAPPAGTSPTPTGPLDLSAVVSALGSIQGKLDEVGGILKGAIEADTRQTTAAIRQSSGTRLVQNG